MKRIGLLALCLGLGVSGLLWWVYVSRYELVNQNAILARVHKGMERQQALQALSDAWYHSAYTYRGGDVQDIFLYGPKDRRHVTIVAVFSKLQGGQLAVDRVGTYENYFLDNPGYFEGYQPPLQDAFDRSEGPKTKTP